MSNNIKFNIKFGTGSGVYSFAEDSLFFSDIHKKNIKSFTYPAVIADLYSEKSSWFKGFDEKYFYDTGAFLAAGFSRSKHLFKWYYPVKLVEKSDLKFKNIVRCINDGIKGYRNTLSYNEYYAKKGNNG